MLKSSIVVQNTSSRTNLSLLLCYIIFMKYLERYISSNIERLIKPKLVLELQGLRSVGKSTVLEKMARDNNYTYIKCNDFDFKTKFDQDPSATFNDLLTKATAKIKVLIFDESQVLENLPQLVKDLVDTNDDYSVILSGSRYITRTQLGGTDPLVGRVLAKLILEPLLPSEINNKSFKETFLYKLINAQNPYTFLENYASKGSYKRDDFQKYIIRGGLPFQYTNESTGGELETELYAKSYIETTLSKTLIEERIDIVALRALFSYFFTYTSEVINISNIADNLKISTKAINNYIAILESLYLIKILRPLKNSYVQEMRAQPKIHITDTGIACAVSKKHKFSDLNADIRGRLFETTLVNMLATANEYLFNKYDTKFFRSTKNEVDFVFTNEQFVIGIEIKSSINITDKDYRGLRELKKLTLEKGKKFVGIIIYGGDYLVKLHADDFFLLPAKELLD